jgi:hypothetical protein
MCVEADVKNAATRAPTRRDPTPRPTLLLAIPTAVSSAGTKRFNNAALAWLFVPTLAAKAQDQ